MLRCQLLLSIELFVLATSDDRLEYFMIIGKTVCELAA